MHFSSSDSQTKLMTIAGLPLAYRLFGEGAPILFYNRFRGILDTWDPLFLDTLATKHTIVLFDYPGIGDSEGELSSDIMEVAGIGVQLMNELGFEQFHVAGWSYGGLVAQAALFRNKARVQKRCLLAPIHPVLTKFLLKSSFLKEP